MKHILISIVTPIYNEEAIIASSVYQNIAAAASVTDCYEIILVDDNSTDRSRSIIESEFGKNELVSILHKEVNEGFGGAVKSGIASAKGKYILCVPSDSPLSPAIFSLFFENAVKADVLVSYRKERRGYSVLMKFNSIVFHALVSVLFNMQLRDYNWIHMYHRRIFDEGKIVITYPGIFMLSEVLIKAKRKGYTFYEFEVEQNERLTGIASASRLPTMAKTLFDIFHFWITGKA